MQHFSIHTYIIKVDSFSYIRTYIDKRLSRENPASNTVEIFFGRKNSSVQLVRNFFPRSNTDKKFFLGRNSSRSNSVETFFLCVKKSNYFFSVEILLGRKNSSVELGRNFFPCSNLVEMFCPRSNLVEIFSLGRT